MSMMINTTTPTAPLQAGLAVLDAPAETGKARAAPFADFMDLGIAALPVDVAVPPGEQAGGQADAAVPADGRAALPDMAGAPSDPGAAGLAQEQQQQQPALASMQASMLALPVALPVALAGRGTASTTEPVAAPVAGTAATGSAFTALPTLSANPPLPSPAAAAPALASIQQQQQTGTGSAFTALPTLSANPPMPSPVAAVPASAQQQQQQTGAGAPLPSFGAALGQTTAAAGAAAAAPIASPAALAGDAPVSSEAIAAPLATAGAPATATSELKLAAPPAAWQQPLREALGERLQLQLSRNIDQAVIRLDPPNLGRIEIAIRHMGGNLEVNISATHSEVVRQLNTISETMRSDLAARQFTEVAVNVTSATRAAGGSQQSFDQQGRQRQQDGAPDDAEPGRALAEAGHPSSTFSLNGRESTV